MLYDFIIASMSFCVRLAIFDENQPKWLSMSNLTAKPSFPNQAESTLIK